ncbi:DEAD/DEAH box helicase [Paraglaciecola sp. 20A4]|uniref:DEAD/DEAH box helicase n=1 Tax=Paraglaciecola sp. 20A4 TaxID=2687288 RepID=UPI001408BA81|nr:DEAD/DEAH box helicase [Paraglaciecola sp. 20A4]
MRFENSSSTLLSITKAKAKMYELGIEEEHHIRLTTSPSKLLIMTIGILGDLCHLQLSEEQNHEFLLEAKNELRSVARYFDSLIQTQLEPNYEYYLYLLGSASYYLSDMPGSASVISSQLKNNRKVLTNIGLEFLLEQLLTAPQIPQLTIVNREIIDAIKMGRTSPSEFPSPPIIDIPLVMSLTSSLLKFYGQSNMREGQNAKRFALQLRNYVHDKGGDREILIADIIAAIVEKRVDNSVVSLLPEFSGISLNEWMPAFGKDTFIDELWPAQRLLGENGVYKGKSAVIQMPTSAGKTKSAELIIRSAFLAERTSVAVIIAPFRSLCREISDSLSEAFLGENVLINQLNDVPQVDAFDEELFAQIFSSIELDDRGSSIVVSTPEKFVYLLRHKPELADQVSLVIYDEGHQFDTGQRGVTYELLLTSLKQKLNPATQHVLISAVLSNADSIGEWLYAEEGTSVNGSECLSTERSVAFCSWTRQRGQFHYVKPLEPNSEEFFVPRVLERIQIPLIGRETKQRYFPDKSDKSSIAAYLGAKLSEFGPVAIFCGTKITVKKICKAISLAADRIDDLYLPMISSAEDELTKIAKLSALHLGEGSVLTKAILLGILPHSSGVPNGLRISVEYAMEHGLGRCVVCTSTLAQGVNLPIKYLIVSGVFQGQKRISTRDFHNLLGRAGRSGKHTEGSVIFTDTELFDKRHSTQRWQWKNMQAMLDPLQSEHCSSSLLSLAKPFEDDPFDINPIKFIQDPDKYIQLSIKAAKGQDISGLLAQMDLRKAYFKSIESYLLANSSEEDLIESKILELYSSTLAYSLANDDERVSLQSVFTIAATSVNTVEVGKRTAFGKALLGVAELHKIETWINENIELLSEELLTDHLLDVLWPLATDVAQNKVLHKLVGENAGIYIAKQWLAGDSYIDILNQANEREYQFIAGSQQRALTIDNILNVCDSALGYDVMLVIGAIADLMESQERLKAHSEQVRNLQRSLKLGLKSDVEHLLYAKGLSDRYVCRYIGNLIMLTGGDKTIGESFFEDARAYLEPALQQFPSVFAKTIYG